ncbi:branched-chain amino acid ABC transporter permease [Salmonella enterica subsp. arizonae]|nr:branched-chain amino acid ABC transporter permease [Salmonella enterica subsp. arizonae]
MKHYFSCLKGDTIKAIFLVCLAVGVVGMSYGSLAMAYGFPMWVPFVLSIFVLAGASEFMFIGIVASGGNPLAAAAAGLLVNARHVPFGVTVRDLVGTRAASFFGCHIMNDESVVFGLSQKTPEQRKAAYWLCGLGVAILWADRDTTRHTGRQIAARAGDHWSGCRIPGDLTGAGDPGV